MLINLLVGFLGIVLSAFIYWKRLREDYPSEIIFNSAFIVYALIILAWTVSSRFFPAWFFWAETLGVILGLTLSVIKFKIRFYESLEGMFFSLLPWISFTFLSDSVINSSLASFIGFIVSLFFIFVFYYFSLHYKNFSWYKSGKIGFAGLATAGIFFLVRAAIAIFFTNVLSFSGKFEAYISGALAFIIFLLIFNLGKQEK